jgi:hypothetical protein
MSIHRAGTFTDMRDGEGGSNRSTIPELCVKHEVVGGRDIIREMFHAGELEQTLKDRTRGQTQEIATRKNVRVVPESVSGDRGVRLRYLIPAASRGPDVDPSRTCRS